MIYDVRHYLVLSPASPEQFTDNPLLLCDCLKQNIFSILTSPRLSPSQSPGQIKNRKEEFASGLLLKSYGPPHTQLLEGLDGRTRFR